MPAADPFDPYLQNLNTETEPREGAATSGHGASGHSSLLAGTVRPHIGRGFSGIIHYKAGFPFYKAEHFKNNKKTHGKDVQKRDCLFCQIMVHHSELLKLGTGQDELRLLCLARGSLVRCPQVGPEIFLMESGAP